MSGESIYVYYDSGTNLLHFRDGTSWLMGCVSSGEEQDSGTLYPTVLEDRNGNQIIITYGAGLGTSSFSSSPTAVAINSSARIVSVEDTRATGTPRTTYNFVWSLPDVNGIQHLASISNTIGTSETYAFAFVQGLGFYDPWGGNVTAPATTGLSKITNSALNTYYWIFTDNSGQMLRLELPYGGYLGWAYGTNQYQWPSSSNTIQLMAVNSRVLASAANASILVNGGNSATQWSYPIAYTAAPTNESVVAGSCVTDSGAGAKRCWTFGNGGSTGIPVTFTVQRWGMVSGTMTQLRNEALSYEPDAAGNPIAFQNLTTDYTGASGNVYSQTALTVDPFGNTTAFSSWDYSTALPGSTATRTVNMTYKNNCSSPWTGSTTNDCPYVNLFMLGLPLQTTLTEGSTTTTLASNTYDTYTKYPILAAPGIFEYDSAYLNVSTPTRGNVTQSVQPGSTTNYQFDVTGMVAQADDNNGHAVSITAATGMNNTVPGTIQPNTGSANDSSLATALSYTPFLAVTSAVAPNASTAYSTYDSVGRISSTQIPSHSTDGSVAGATTNYVYAFGSTVGGNITNGAFTTTATTNTHWATSVIDGLGRVATQTTGYGATSPTTVSTVDTVYGPCACSPAGKMVKMSQPYAPAGTEVWTAYTYDYLGRTLSVTLPDAASTTTYTYQGNWTTVVDPARKWKQYQSDVFGNTVNVVEPDPLASPVLTAPPATPSISVTGTLVTAYTYDGLNHLVNVSMPRAGVTQTRTFVYDPVTLRLTGMTSPETGTSSTNGTTSYTYNADGTLATRTDPKSQVTTYTYDAYQRPTTVTHGPSATQTYAGQTYNYTYDTGTNGWGRLTGVSWGPLVSGQITYTESYGYTIAGDMSAKALTVYKSSGQVNLGGSFAYDSEGKPSALTYPGWGYSSTGIVQSYTYDSMSRLTGVSNVEGAGAVSPCTPASPTTATVTWATGGAYNAAGQLTDLERFAGIGYTCTGAVEGYFNEHWQYNALNQLAEIDTSAQSGGFPVSSPNPGTANVFFTRYNFSATQNNGQAMSVDDARQGGANIAYTYDALKRLTKATTTSWTQNIGYDGFGNITSKDVPAGSAEPTFPGAVSSKNWLTGVSYDLNGNALAVNAFALTYDAENRLATATSGSAVESYSYDESNHRLEKIFGTSDYLYFYGPGGKLLSIRAVSTTGLTSVVADRVYFGGLLLGSAGTVGSQDVSTLTDRLGTAATGYPYGTNRGNAAGNDQPDFATYTKDGTTGFEYANQRYYSAGYATFTSPDPSMGNVDYSNPISWNAYRYVNGDPISANDPNGLSAVTLPPVVSGTNCSTGFIDYAAQFGETIQDLFNDDSGILAMMSYFEQQGTGSAADQAVWAAVDWTFLNRWNLSDSNKAWYYGPSNIPATFAATVTTGPTRSQVFTSSGQLASGFNTLLINVLTGPLGTAGCAGLAAAFDVAQGTINANNNNPIPGLGYIADPVPGSLGFGSNGSEPTHSAYTRQMAVGEIIDGSNVWTFFSDSYAPPPPIKRPAPKPHRPRNGAL